MALYSRLCNKQLISGALGLYRANALTTPIRFPSTQWGGVSLLQTSATKLAETHDARNARLQRPLSPHLTIYSVQLTAFLSITHRMTGVALATYTMAFGVGALFCDDFDSVVNTIQSWELSSATLAAGKFLLAAPLSFHLLNGIRHLLWDMGKFLTIKEVYSTGYAVLGLTLVMLGVLMAK